MITTFINFYTSKIDMRFKERLKKLLKEEDAAVLLSYMKSYKLNTKVETQKRLDYHITKCRSFLAKNHEKVTKARREHTKKLGYFIDIKKIVKRL